MSNWYITPSNSDLVHHGVLGMKWGIRRYQNKDGSLTSAGRKHYGYSSNLKTGGIKNIKNVDGSPVVIPSRNPFNPKNNPNYIRKKWEKDNIKQVGSKTNQDGTKTNTYQVRINHIDDPITIKETNSKYLKNLINYETETKDSNIETSELKNNQDSVLSAALTLNIAKAWSKDWVNNATEKIFNEAKNEDWIKSYGVSDSDLKRFLNDREIKPSINIHPIETSPKKYSVSCTIFPSFESPFGEHMLTIEGVYDDSKGTIEFDDYYQMNG